MKKDSTYRKSRDFTNTTIKSHRLPQHTDGRLEIFSGTGQRIATIDKDTKPVGLHRVSWNRNGGAAFKIYFYRRTAGDKQLTRKMMMIK